MDNWECFAMSCMMTLILIPTLLLVFLAGVHIKKSLCYYLLIFAYSRMDREYLCTICLETVYSKYGNLSSVYRLWCGHWFHKKCILFWLMENNSCPNCRSVVKANHRQFYLHIAREYRRRIINFFLNLKLRAYLRTG